MAEVEDIDRRELDEHLAELRRITALEKDLKAAKDRHTAAAIPILERLGSVMIYDPIDKTPQIANVRAAERIVVDAGELYDALIEQYEGDVETAETVWKGVLKPPEVDTKDEGLFHLACMERTEEGLPALISAETVAKVVSFKKAKAFIGFSKPGG